MTYSFDPLQPQQAQMTQAATIRAGMSQGATQTGLIQYDEGTDGTRAISTLMTVGAEKLAPVAQKMQEKAFLTGMQRAASGEALTGIINDQPWYSKIFGTTPVVEGARAYTAQAVGAEWASATEAKMPELRKQSPEAVTDYIRESFAGYATGDADTDDLIRRTITEQAPILIKQHTRENFKYLQEQAKESRVRSYVSSFNRVNDMLQATPGMYTADEIEDIEMDAVVNLMPTEGEDLDSWKEDLTVMVSSLASEGKFHAIRSIEKHGVLAHMKTADKVLLTAQIKQAESVWAVENGKAPIQQEYLEVMHNAKMGRVTPAEAYSWMVNQNTDYELRTGSKVQLFDLGEQNQVLSSTQSARAAWLAEQQKAAGKAAEDAVLTAYTKKRLTEDDADQVAAASGGTIKQQDARAVARQEFNAMSMGDKVNRLKTWALGGTTLQPDIKYDLNVKINSANSERVSENFIDVATLYQSLATGTGGPAAVAYTFDAEQAVLLDSFVKFGGLSGEPRDMVKAFEFAKNQQELAGIKSLTPVEAKEVDAFVTDRMSTAGWMFGLFGRDKPNAAASHMARQLVADEYSKIKHTITGEAAYEQALQAAKSRMEQVGQYAYRRSLHGDQGNLTALMSAQAGGTISLTDEDAQDAMNDYIKEKFEEVDASLDQVVLMRKDDRNGVASFTAMSFSDMIPRFIEFSSEDLLHVITKKKTQALSNQIATENSPYKGATSYRAIMDARPKYEPLKKE